MEVGLRFLLSLPFFVLFLSHIADEVSATKMTLYNKCPHPVWPGVQPSAGNPILAGGGFELRPGKSHILRLPHLWSGRVWGRHLCSFDSTGSGTCATGDCGGKLACGGIGGAPPATLVEITLGADADFYDVSLVDGYNLPISVVPSKGKGKKCGYAGCGRDLNAICPKELRVGWRKDGRVVGCKSACLAFSSDRSCCRGAFGSAQSCGPTGYSKFFKKACPRAYSYAYDDRSSLVTCHRGDYLVIFCPQYTRF